MIIYQSNPLVLYLLGMHQHLRFDWCEFLSNSCQPLPFQATLSDCPKIWFTNTYLLRLGCAILAVSCLCPRFTLSSLKVCEIDVRTCCTEFWLKQNRYSTLHELIMFLQARCDSNAEISYVTAHMQTIRAQPCFQAEAYPRAPLGS